MSLSAVSASHFSAAAGRDDFRKESERWRLAQRNILSPVAMEVSGSKSSRTIRKSRTVAPAASRMIHVVKGDVIDILVSRFKSEEQSRIRKRRRMKQKVGVRFIRVNCDLDGSGGDNNSSDRFHSTG